MSGNPVAAYQDAQDRDKLVEQHAYLVKRIAHHLMAKLPNSVQLDDLLQAGMLGLIESIGKYDASKGASFDTYAGIRIRGAMLDEMRRGDWAPRSVHRNARMVSEAMRRVEKRNGGEASDREVAQELGLSMDKYFAMVNDATACRLSSYEEVSEGDDASGLPAFFADDHGAERQEVLERVTEAIGELSERERLVIALYYDEELNLKEIGAVLEVSESRVSQILSKATLRLRAVIADWQDG
ncbi:MAG: RNA polymerase sigma factor FliA [Pseudomonadota bacterium]